LHSCNGSVFPQAAPGCFPCSGGPKARLWAPALSVSVAVALMFTFLSCAWRSILAPSIHGPSPDTPWPNRASKNAGPPLGRCIAGGRQRPRNREASPH